MRSLQRHGLIKSVSKALAKPTCEPRLGAINVSGAATNSEQRFSRRRCVDIQSARQACLRAKAGRNQSLGRCDQFGTTFLSPAGAAMRAIARAEAKREAAMIEIMRKILGKKLS